MIITASKLFAPHEHRKGDERCFYCGLDCDQSHTVKDHVKKTFTNLDIVKCPGSEYVCGCCVASLITVTTTVLFDGDVKTGRGAAPRTYSWVLTGHQNKAFSKKHFDFAREMLSNPPAPPFSIVLADSGKKQIIFRAPVNFERDIFNVQFEEEQILVDRARFEELLTLATYISAAAGKRALLSPDFNTYRQCVEYFGDEKLIEQWDTVHSEPMAKLAAWVCKGKDDARLESSVSERLQTATCGDSRPSETSG
jgi:CRISPR type IV-associated protein Csf1